MDDHAIHDLTPAYALDALDESERTAYESHLATCDRCRTDLAQLQETAVSLAYAVPAPAPPAALRERILDGARAENVNVVPLRSRRVPYALGAIAAAAASVAIAVGVWAASVASENDELRALADPHAAVYEFDQGPASGRLYVSPDESATLVLDSDPAPAGKDYEVWVIDGGRPERAGLYEGGRNTIRLSQAVPRGATVAVTVERDGGVDAPTTDPVFAVTTGS